MPRILVLFAHPALEKSRVHRTLLAHMPALPHLTLHDLYEEYADFDIDVSREQELLAAHDIIVMQHPFYWYSTPPLLKQWLDLVLEHGWAYGREGRALVGKTVVNALSAGGGEMAYQHGGHNRFTVRELLAPIEQTVRLCRMRYLPPYVIFGSHRLDPPDIEQAAARYAEFLRALHDDALDLSAADAATTMNELFLPARTQVDE